MNKFIDILGYDIMTEGGATELKNDLEELRIKNSKDTRSQKHNFASEYLVRRSLVIDKNLMVTYGYGNKVVILKGTSVFLSTLPKKQRIL